MFTNKGQVAVVGALAIGLVVLGGWGHRPPAANSQTPAAPAKEKVVEFPTTPAPVQVLASIDKDNTLVIKTNVQMPGDGGVQFGQTHVGGLPGGPPIPIKVLPPLVIGKVRTRTYNLDEVKVFDTQGKKLDKKEVVKQLKKETLAVASLLGEKVEAQHLRLLKEGTLIFVLPAPAARILPPGIPLGPPGNPPGGGVFPVPEAQEQ